MAYIKITNGTQEPYSIGKLRRDNKTISFPKVVEASTLESYGVYSVVTAGELSYTEATQVITRNTTATEVDGQWTYEWTVRDKTPDELAEDAANAGALVRATRKKLLSGCDWIVTKAVETGTSVPSDWSAYRTALRDLPQHPNFPDVIWPTKPE
tara:strand:- start:4201 stop:4662 length:462 start_codon:yes stop_codon:yes gene_type:complete